MKQNHSAGDKLMLRIHKKLSGFVWKTGYIEIA